MFKFFSGFVLGVLAAEKYNLPKVESIIQRLTHELDEWSKKKPKN